MRLVDDDSVQLGLDQQVGAGDVRIESVNREDVPAREEQSLGRDRNERRGLELDRIRVGVGLAGGYAGVIAFASIGLAIRGRAGAASVFPLRACFFAPLWILERSLSVYWALARKLHSGDSETFRVAGSELRDETYSQRVVK